VFVAIAFVAVATILIVAVVVAHAFEYRNVHRNKITFKGIITL